MTQTQNEAEFEFEWLLRQKYEFKILTLIAVLADNNLAYADATRDLKKSEFSNLDAFWNQQKGI